MAFENLLNNYLQVKYQTPEELVYCPNDQYPLEQTDRGLHCVLCGWTPAIPQKFIPQAPSDANAGGV